MTVDMNRWTYGAGGGVPFILWCFSWGRISPNLNKPVNSVTQHRVPYCEQSGLQSKGERTFSVDDKASKWRGGKTCVNPLRVSQGRATDD